LDPCPFCSVERTRIWIQTEYAIAFANAYPVVDGHTLIVPRKHVSTIYELTIPEQKAIWELVGEVRQRLLTGLTPARFSMGFTDTTKDGGSSAHAAVHLVPRRRGDRIKLPDGIEWVADDPLFV
jgi:diadenosine tetraphosphate (Ap4A) HIT family hydrolase